MVQLPDIPIGQWLADQEASFGRKIGGLFPALEFQTAAREQDAEIPPDISMPGGEDTYLQEQEWMRQQEEERQRQEEERRRQEAEQQQRAVAAQQEQERQQALADAAHQQASSLGILTPDSALDHFRSLEGTQPGLGNNDASTGALDTPSYQTPAQVGQQAAEQNLDTPSYQTPAQTVPQPEDVQTPRDFQSFADGLNQQTFGPEQPDVAQASSQTAADDFRSGLKTVWDETGNVLGYIKSAVNVSPKIEREIKEAGLPNPYEIPRAIGRAVEESATPEGSGLHNETSLPGLPDALREPLNAAQRLGFSIVSQTLPARVAGNLWKEAGLPVPDIGGFEVNPGEFLVPIPKGVGGELASKAEVATSRAGEALASRLPDVGSAIERGTGAALGAAGRGIGRGAAALGEAAGGTAQYLDRLAGKVYDDAVESIKQVFPDAPESQIAAAASAIRAKQLPLAEEGAPGSRRVYHGGAAGNNLIDPGQFSEDGLFGPAQYVTSASPISEHYMELAGPGATVRPANLDDRAVLFHADKPVPQSDLRKIRDAMYRQFGDDPTVADVLQEYDMLADAPADYYRRAMRDTNGRAFYEQLSRDLTPPEQWRVSQEYGGVETEIGDKRLVNQLLSDAGFDGVYYNGERLGIPNAPAHDAVAIFPEKLDALRNAFTGEMGGAAEAAARAPGAVDYALSSLPARRAVGAATGAAAGAASGDETTTPGERLRAAGLGAVGGALAAQQGTLAAARLVDHLIARGALSSDVLLAHPPSADRIRALLALAAKGLPDDAQVQIPGMVGFLTRAEPATRAEVAPLIDGPKTAGQIRQLLSEQADPASLGKEARDLVVDLLAGVGGRGRRAAETRADRTSVEGLGREGRLPWEQATPEFAGSRIMSPNGPARELNDPDTVARVHDVADRLGVDRPVVYVSDSPELNAAATRGRSNEPIVALTRGLLDANLPPEEFDALLAHELAHTTEQSLGEQLLGRAQDLLASARSQGPSIPEKGIWRARVMDGIQAPEGTPPWIQKNLELTYNEAMRLLGKSQAERSAAKRDRWQAEASKAWGTYESWLTRARKEAGDVPAKPASRGTRVPRETVPAHPENADVAVEAPTNGGAGAEADRGLPGGPPAEPAELAGAGGTERVGADLPGVDATPSFEPEPLPQALDPQQRWDHEDAGKLVGQLKDALVMNPALRERMLTAAADMMSRPKVRGRHIDQLLQWVGERQGVARGMTKEEAGAAWKDRFLREHGWLAPEGEAGGAAGAAADAGAPVAAAAGDAARPLADRPVAARPRDLPDEDLYELTPEDRANLEARRVERRGRRSLNDQISPEQREWLRQQDQANTHRMLTDRNVGDLLLPSHVMGSDAGFGESSFRRAEQLAQDAGYGVTRVENSEGRPRLRLDSKPDSLFGPTNEELARLEERFPEARPDPEIPDEPTVEDLTDLGWSNAVRRKIDPAVNPPPTERDPRYDSLRTRTPPAPLTSPGIFERIYKFWAPKLTDTVAVLRQYQDDVAREYKKQTGATIPAGFLAAELKRLDPNRQAEMDADRFLKPALRVFRNLGISDETINTYLSYVHDIDVVGAKGDPNRQLPSGATLQQAKDFVAARDAQWAALSPEQQAALDYAKQSVWDLGDRILQLKRDAGLINDQTYRTLRQTYPHYIPTKILDFINDDARLGVGQSLSINSSTIHELSVHGTEREALDALPAMLGALYEAHSAANKNRVFNAFDQMVVAAKLLESGGIAPSSGASGRRVSELAGLVFAKPPGTKRANEFTAVRGFIDGVKQELWVHKSLGDVTKFDAPTVIPILSGLTAAFKAGATSRNPVFLTANMMLDLSTYLIREMSRAGGPHHIGDVLGVYGATLGEFLLHPRNWGDIAAHEYRGDMQRYLAEGGGSAGLTNTRALRPEPINWKGFKLDVDTILQKLGWRQESELEQGVRHLGRGLIEVNNARDFVERAWDLATLKPVEAIGERIELVPRVAAMRLAERRGASTVEAVNAGRTTTLDFNKGGSWTRTINQVIPFFNVGVQGATEVQRAWAQAPAAFPATVGTMLVAPMIAAEVWNQSDPQRRKDYYDVPNYIKDQGLVLMLPGEAPVDAQGNRHPQFFHFRYREFAPLAMLTRESLQHWYFDRLSDPERRSLGELGLAATQQLSPVSVADPADFATSFLPPGLGTLVQASPQVDRDFFRNARIRSAYADERASPLSKAAGPALGMRPSVFEFASRDIGTGFAGMLHGASEILFGDRPTSLQEKPVVGGLAGRVVKGSIGQEATYAREHTLTPSAEKILEQHKLSWRPSPADPEIRNIPLTRAEYGDYQRRINQVTDQTIHRVTADPRFSTLNAAAKQELLQNAVSRARATVQGQIIRDIPRDERDRRLKLEREKGHLPARIGA